MPCSQRSLGLDALKDSFRALGVPKESFRAFPGHLRAEFLDTRHTAEPSHAVRNGCTSK
jgi:hypothetical protein